MNIEYANDEIQLFKYDIAFLTTTKTKFLSAIHLHTHMNHNWNWKLTCVQKKKLGIYFYLFLIGIVPIPIFQHWKRHDSVSFELKIYSKVRAYFRRCHYQPRSRFYVGVHRWCSFSGHHCRWYYWCECNWCNRWIRNWAYEALAVPMYSLLLLTSMWWPSYAIHSILFFGLSFVKLSQRQRKKKL